MEGGNTARYHVYLRQGAARLTTWILPLACVQYYPLLYLLGKNDRLLYAFTPLAGFVFFVPCWLFWKFGLRHYRSTGS